MTTFQNLVDLAFGGPEDGQVNFNALHSLMYALVFKFKLSDEKALLENDVIEKIKESSKNYQLLKALKESVGVNSFVGLAERLRSLETFWENLNNLPSNEIIIKTTEANVPNLTPLTDMWDKIKTGRMVEASESGIQKILCMLDDLMKFSAELSNYNKELSEALLGTDEDEDLGVGGAGGPGGPGGKPKMNIKEAIEELGKTATRFELMQEQMASILARMGETNLPSDEFFDNLPTWSLLEQLLKGTYENILSGKEKRALGEIPLSDELKKILADLGAMASYNDELLARVQTLENNLQYLTDRAATKADIQKLNVKMAEVQGIASAVDRLLCRIQGSEDQICCLRQVINKIYGCVSVNAGAGKTSGVTACLGNPPDGAQAVKVGSSVGSTGGGGSGSVSENQLRIFMDQLTKIECELEAIKRNLVSIDGIKADVQNLFSIVNELDENKLDKCLLASELAQKADKSQVEDKVSQTCFENVCQGLNSVVNDILSKILENDAECRNVFSQLEKLVLTKTDREELETLKDQLESKLRCMAKNFVGLQKFVTEEGEGDDSLSFKRNINQNRNETPSSDAPSQKHQQQQQPRGPPPSLPLNPGLPGNKVIRQFPLVVKGVEMKGVNMAAHCGIKQTISSTKTDAKKSGTEDTFKLSPEQCKDLMSNDKKTAVQHNMLDPINPLPDIKDFVSGAQQTLAKVMNDLRSCSSGNKLTPPCVLNFGERSKPDTNESGTAVGTTARLADKTVYSGLLIGSDPKNQLTMDFENQQNVTGE